VTLLSPRCKRPCLLRTRNQPKTNYVLAHSARRMNPSTAFSILKQTQQLCQEGILNQLARVHAKTKANHIENNGEDRATNVGRKVRVYTNRYVGVTFVTSEDANGTIAVKLNHQSLVSLFKQKIFSSFIDPAAASVFASRNEAHIELIGQISKPQAGISAAACPRSTAPAAVWGKAIFTAMRAAMRPRT
jgi:hypothetical protein